METGNPYQPPDSRATPADADSPPRFLASLLPASLAVALAMLAWVVLVTTLDAAVSYRFDILLWAATLFLSSSLSTFAICRQWRTRIQPLAFGVTFGVFSIAFGLLEGDTSNGTVIRQMVIVYGSLLTLPVAMFLLARRVTRDPSETARLEPSPRI